MPRLGHIRGRSVCVADHETMRPSRNATIEPRNQDAARGCDRDSFPYPMADSAAPSTSRAPRSGPDRRRRSRAASPIASEPSALSAQATGPTEAADTADTAAARSSYTSAERGPGFREDAPSSTLPERDGLDDVQCHAMNLDPRQGTLAGFELPADALDSLRAHVAMPVTDEPAAVLDLMTFDGSTSELGLAIPDAKPASGSQSVSASASASASASPDETSASLLKGATAPVIEPAPTRRERRQVAQRQPTDRAFDSQAQATPSAALTEMLAELSHALAETRRAAADSRRHITRLVIFVLAVSSLLLALSVAQMIVLVHVGRASVAAQEKTEALLRSQQSALAAFQDTASVAAADIRGTADALNAKLAALPSRPTAQGQAQAQTLPQSPAAKHVRPVRVHKASDKTRAANDS